MTGRLARFLAVLGSGAAFMILVSCACRTVQVDGVADFAPGTGPTVPPNYVDLTARIRRRDPEVEDYAVFDLRWSDAGSFEQDAKIVVQIRGESEGYVAPDGREDLSLDSEEANSRVPVDILFATGGESRWVEQRLWDLPIRSTGVFDGAPLEPNRQRRLLENAGLVLLTVRPVLRRMVPWAIDWVLEQPLSLFLAMNSEQRSALTDREIVKLMTSLVEFDYDGAQDLGFGRTRVPITVGVDDIDFAVGQLTLFRAARGAGASFGVESMSLIVDDERRVDLRLRTVGSHWPDPIGVHGSGSVTGDQWPLALDGGIVGPHDSGEVALRKLPEGRVLDVVDGRIAILKRPGEDGLQELVELREDGVRPFRSDPQGVFDRLHGVRHADGSLLFALHWLDMRDLQDHLLVYRLDESGPALLADSLLETGWFDDDPMIWAAFLQLLERWAPISPKADAFIRVVDGERELVRLESGVAVPVVRIAEREATVSFDPDGSLLWIVDSESTRGVQVEDGQIVFDEENTRSRRITSGWRELRSSAGGLELLDLSADRRLRVGDETFTPRGADRTGRFYWAREEGRLVEMDLSTGESSQLPIEWPSEDVEAFDGHAVFSAGDGPERQVVIRRGGAYPGVVAYEATGRRVLGVHSSNNYDDFDAFTAIDRVAEGDEDRRVSASLFLERVRGGVIESSWSLGTVFEPLARRSQGRLDAVSYRDLGAGRVLLQIASDAFVFWLDREDPVWVRLPYRIGARSTIQVLEEPNWILYESDGKTHAYSLARLESLALRYRTDPLAPELLEAFPAFDVDAMWHVLTPGTRDPIR